MDRLHVDTVIFGGGVTGLWTLDAVRRSGRSALLVEGHRLGAGQTISSQGILHSGLKYSLAGVLTGAAREAREMPQLWRRCLLGEAQPDLRRVTVSAEAFHLWGTQSAASKLGLFGAQLGLQVTPRTVPRSEYPTVLKSCPGSVYRVDEQVLAPRSLVAALAAPHQEVMLQLDPATEVEFVLEAAGRVSQIRLHSARFGRTLEVDPGMVVLTAGKGNALLRTRLGLDARAMQLRPLHYVLVRGEMPEFHGHCIDFSKTRVSITSARDAQGRMVWQIGGQISEDGVQLDPETLIDRTQRELLDVLPGFDLAGTEWTTCRIDRAEGATLGGTRPDSYRLLQEGNVLTAWPTKLVLAPQVAQAVCAALPTAAGSPLQPLLDALAAWPRPTVALPAWEELRRWMPVSRALRRPAA